MIRHYSGDVSLYPLSARVLKVFEESLLHQAPSLTYSEARYGNHPCDNMLNSITSKQAGGLTHACVALCTLCVNAFLTCLTRTNQRIAKIDLPSTTNNPMFGMIGGFNLQKVNAG